MWHKVSPISFRIPYIKTWKSAWFSDKKTYKTELSLDLTIRQTLDKELTWIPVWDTLISIEQDIIRVDVYTIKASLILGKTGENLEKIQNILTRKTGKKVIVDIKEIKNPALNAKIVWFDVKTQIEKRMPYKRAIKQAIQKSMEKWAKWIKIKVWGRLNGAEIARKETFKEGNIPTQTIRSDIDYTTMRAETVYGTLGLKIWIYKGDIYKKSK
jgi:small subunit ribosomal protein S3